jgi:cbb3-type cytochrome oxidase subunit 3
MFRSAKSEAIELVARFIFTLVLFLLVLAGIAYVIGIRIVP